MKTMFKTFYHMDYLTKSYESVDHYFDLGLQDFAVFHVVDEVRAAPHYHKAYKLQCGAVLNMSDDTRQGCKLDIGGDALENIRAAKKWSDEKLLKVLATSRHKRTTRLDYCFNINGYGNPYHLRKYIDNGKYTGRLKPAPSINTPGQRRAETVYFGSKDSDFRIRVYDKATELKMLWGHFVRCEAQLRGEYAQNAVADALENGVELNQHVRTKISKATGKIDLKWWEFMMNGQQAKVTGIKRKQTKFEARMAQLLDEILTKARQSKEQHEYITGEWIMALANGLTVKGE